MHSASYIIRTSAWRRFLLMIKTLRYVAAATICALLLGSCHVGRFFIYNFADIRDYRKFHSVKMPHAAIPFSFAVSDAKPGLKLPTDITIRSRHYDWHSLLNKTKTVAFVVIRNDSILYQEYLRGYDEESVVPSFSVAKSYTSLLVGIAIDEGAIASVNDPVTKYLPELRTGFDNVTIRHLLDMQSGIRFNEGYLNPFGDVAKYYYGTNLAKYVRKMKLSHPPGERFEYRSGNPQLLGMIVERSVHKNLADYMEEKVWKYIGTEHDASWSVDSRRHNEVKAFCCLNATTLDFARLGRLYLNKGNWNGRQVVSKNWVEQSLDVSDLKNSGIYSYQWWHTVANGDGHRVPSGDFFAEGILGQFVYVYPQKNIIIVRLGKKDGYGAWPYLMRAIAEAN